VYWHFDQLLFFQIPACRPVTPEPILLICLLLTGYNFFACFKDTVYSKKRIAVIFYLPFSGISLLKWEKLPGLLYTKG
jgi:hypothetical protein